MAIKNKDGSIVTLRGPNPLMNEQVRWGDFTLHNLKFSSTTETVADLRPKVADEPPPPKDDFITELVRTKTDVPVEKTVEKPIVKPEPPQKTSQLPDGITKMDVYCLPATIRNRVDELYGEKRQTIQYDSPFLFEAVIVKEEDLYLKIWTTVEKAVQKGSILYPKKNEQRWWRVSESEPKSNGWIVTSVPSDYNPAFNGVS